MQSTLKGAALRPGLLRLAKAVTVRRRAISKILGRGDTAHTVAAETFAGDGMVSRHFVGWMAEASFASAVGAAFDGLPPQRFYQHLAWRIHIATWSAKLAMSQAPGALVECGVWHGFLSRAICDYVDIDTSGRDFYLVDMWGGADHHDGYPQDIYEAVRNRFAAYSQVHLVRGRVPDVLQELDDVADISYLSLDMNDGHADVSALEWAWDRLSPGSVVYIDDYGWDYPDLRRRLDLFLSDKTEKLLHFPSGNSILIKERGN